MGKIFSKKEKYITGEVTETNEERSDNVPAEVAKSPYSNVSDNSFRQKIQNRDMRPVPPSNAGSSTGQILNPYSNVPDDLQKSHPFPGQISFDITSRDSSPYLVFDDQPQEKTIVSNQVLYTVLYDYEKRSESEISISEGDTLEILNTDDDNWWLAYNRVTNSEGYVPANYIAELDSLNSQPWYFGDIKRTEANRYLMLSENEIGSFLVRESLSNDKSAQPTPYSLSVRFGPNIKNYRIGNMENSWYVTSIPDIVHNTVQDLINHFKNNQGLCCLLGKPCFNPEQPVTAGLSHGDKWEMDKSAVKLGKMIGSGNFGEVWEGTACNARVAIKTLKPGTMQPEKFLEEAILMKKLQHKNLILLYAVCTKDEPIYIITEFMVNGDLLNYLKKKEGQKLAENLLIDISAQVAAGMAYLEENKYIHRDLAARNVLVGEKNIVKVADFGLTRLIEDDEYSPQAGTKFPVKWTAPEAITHCSFTIKSDIWSFGILVFEIMSKGKMPYQGKSNAEVMSLLPTGYRMPKDQNCPQNIYELMLQCWNANPQRRPTFQSLSWTLDEYYNNMPGYQTEKEFTLMENSRFR